MTDFFDGSLPELDLGGETLPDPDAPVVETEVVTETWFAEFETVVPEVGDVALPDPFSAEAVIGGAGLVGGLLAGRKPRAAAPAPASPTSGPPSASSPLNAETIAAAIELGQTSATLADRLLQLVRPRRKAK